MKRLRLPGVLPVELWDAPCRGGILQGFRHRADLPAVLAELIDDLPRRLPGATAADARAVAARIDHVHLLGGGADEALRDALTAHGVPCSLGDDALFAAARAGLGLLAGAEAPLSIDVGQTSLKLCSRAGAWRAARDLGRAPRSAPATETTATAEATERFVLDAVLAHAPCDALLLALPCEVGDAGQLGASSYGWRTDGAWPLRLAALAGAGAAGPMLLNDAELAAAAWLRTPAAASAGATLVLTIGFGVGGALVEAR
ncbi:MAG: hypothetical protein WKG00_00185 [Polyangiaceae bacterium]